MTFTKHINASENLKPFKVSRKSFRVDNKINKVFPNSFHFFSDNLTQQAPPYIIAVKER